MNREGSVRRDEDRLADIVRASAAIAEVVEAGRSHFDEGERYQVFVLRQLTVIGEATAAPSRQLKAQHPEVDWRGPQDLRNRLVHAYFDVDWDIVWRTGCSDVPPYAAQIAAILEGYTEA